MTCWYRYGERVGGWVGGWVDGRGLTRLGLESESVCGREARQVSVLLQAAHAFGTGRLVGSG